MLGQSIDQPSSAIGGTHSDRVGGNFIWRRRVEGARIQPFCAELLAKPLACVHVRTVVQQEGLSVRRPLAEKYKRKIDYFQTQPHVIFQGVRRKAVESLVRPEVRVAVVRPWRDIGA